MFDENYVSDELLSGYRIAAKSWNRMFCTKILKLLLMLVRHSFLFFLHANPPLLNVLHLSSCIEVSNEGNCIF